MVVGAVTQFTASDYIETALNCIGMISNRILK